MKKNQENSNKIYYFLYFIIVAITMLPLICGYVMQGSAIEEWAVRVQEVSLFPSLETILKTDSRTNALHSGLWFLPSSVLYTVTNNLYYSYTFQMFFFQIGTVFSSYLMFYRIFSEEEDKRVVFFGVLLYMTCPYRLYCCYDAGDLFQVAAWMIVPVYVWAVTGIIKKKKWMNIFIAACALAGIGYANSIYFLAATGLSVLIMFFFKAWKIVFSLAGGCIFFVPGLFHLAQYLFTDKYNDVNLSLQSIMPSGYVIGDYFAFFVYREGRPGIGFGLLFALLSGLWLIFVTGKWEKSKVCRIFFIFTVLLILFSLKYFPWDYVQRIGSFGLKLVSVIGTPVVFGGMAQLILCIPAALSAFRISKTENHYIAKGISLLILFSVLVWCIYFSNTLTYQRLPY